MQTPRDLAVAAILEPSVLHSLRQEQLWKLIKALSEERKVRYARHRQRKYGNMNKGFSPEELRRFFLMPMHPTARLAFLVMAFRGLRIGEVVRIRAQDIDLQQRRLYLHTEKAGTNDSLFLDDYLYTLLDNRLRNHQDAITAHQGYLLYRGKGANPNEYISPNWLRNEFRRVIKEAGLDRCYAESDERTGRTPRKLHRLTTHSLRHTFATRFYKKTKDLILTSKALRHRDTKSTITYIHSDQTELDTQLQELTIDF